MWAIFFAFFLSFLIGYPIVAYIVLVSNGRFRGDLLELGLVTWAFGTLILGWVAFVLAELGFFSVWVLGGLGLLISNITSMVVYAQWPNRFIRPWSLFHSDHTYKPMSIPFISRMLPYYSEYILLGMWCLVAIFLFFRPHQFITGAADAGVYVNLSAHIANTGRISIDLPLVAEFSVEQADIFLRPTHRYPPATHYWQPALFVTDISRPLSPQFYHLHPVWQAVGYGFSGVMGALYFTGYWALFSGLFVYVLLRRWLVGRPYGRLFSLMALAGLSLNALQIWFARYPTTETLTQLLFWCGFFAFTIWIDEAYKEPLWGILAGLAWGSTFLARIDTFFILLIPLVLAAWLVWQKKWHRTQWGFFLPLIILPLHSVMHALGWSRPYFYNVFGFVGRVLSQNGILLAILIGVGLGLLWWVWQQEQLVFDLFLRYQTYLRWLGVGLVVGLFLYGWFIRPYTTPVSYIDSFSGTEITLYNHENLRRLGWYLSPVGIFSAMLGICLLIWNSDKRHWATLLMGIVFSLLYLYDARNNQHQIYVMRRYVPVVFPFFVVTAVWGIAWLAIRRQQMVAFMVGCAWLIGFAWLARGFVSHIDYVGFPEQLAATAATLDRPAVVLFGQATDIGVGDFLGAPLYFQHGIETFVWRGEDVPDSSSYTAEAIHDWQRQGYTVYWVSLPNGPASPLPAEKFISHSTFAYEFPILEHNFTQRPTAIDLVRWRGEVYQIQSLQK